MTDIIKKLQQEEGELEERVLGKPRESENHEGDAPTETLEPQATNTAKDFGDQPSSGDTQQGTTGLPSDDAVEKLKSLDKRFRRYKASTDQTIHELRQERLGLRSDLAAALEEVEALKDRIGSDDDYVSPFPEDAAKVVGEDALALMEEANRKTFEQARRPVVEAKKREVQEKIQRLKTPDTEPLKTPFAQFTEDVEEEVGNIKDLVKTTEFKDFLKVENSHGVTNRDRWIAAEKALNVNLIKELLEEFHQPKKRTRGFPEQTGAPSSNSRQPMQKQGWTLQAIEDFYDRKAAGFYNKNSETFAEGERLEKEIEDFMSSRINR